MSQDRFSKQLKAILQQDVELPAEGKYFAMKGKFMEKLTKIGVVQREQEMLAALRRYYVPCSELKEIQLKRLVMNSIEETRKIGWFDDLLITLSVQLKRVAVSAFVLAFMFYPILVAWQVLPTVELVPRAKAAHVECLGIVFLNDNLCVAGESFAVAPGDTIQTTNNAVATIYYEDKSLVRLDDQTLAVLGNEKSDQYYLREGAMWLKASSVVVGDDFQVITPVLKASVPLGEVGIRTEKATTELFSDTALVEVQVNNDFAGTTEVVTLTPDKNVQVRKTKRNALITEMGLADGAVRWIEKNKVQDEALGVDVVELKMPMGKLLAAHKNVSRGEIDEAHRLLIEAVELERRDLSVDLGAMDTRDLVILTEIADKSAELRGLVMEIKNRKLERLRQVQTMEQKNRVVTRVLKGVVNKDSSAEQAEKDSDKTVKIVGQAIKEDELL